ncbi:MAG: hypothetical protein M3151_12745 [Actinomycetota bacterium]|nr:hypothetical protein [Actinomycetota bacterium]
MTSSSLARWGGIAAVLSGTLLVAKGLAIVVSVADPSLVPPATLLFALGMVGLHARLRGGSGPLGTAGVLLAWVALAASVVNLIGLVLSIPAPGDPDAPTLLQITYMAAFLAILLGLLALGIATLRTRVMPAPWGAVPLGVGVLWFPLQGVGFAISDGVGLLLGGLAWAFLGYVLWSQSGKPARQPLPRVR